ncbi:hypothetical protein [Lysobacter sp. CA199]|uniref:hypothetical protein n=1 Tax=Lysobacter sp. CA199 TaxID=3455608 RepID=UPI003F8D4FA0
MQTMFDIAVGRCESIDNKTVTIELDSAVVSRLVPGHPWRTSGTSRLKLDIGLCSQRRPPAVGAETFLQREALLKNPTASLDLLGDGNYAPVRLKTLGTDTEPEVVGPASKTTWGDRPRSRWSKNG